MNAELKQAKQLVRQFIRNHYPDERLAMLLAHAQSERLMYNSCCCFLGVLNATHALMSVDGKRHPNDMFHHLRVRDEIPSARKAEYAYCSFGKGSDSRRRRILIPIIRTEMKRRAHLVAEPAAVMAI